MTDRLIVAVLGTGAMGAPMARQILGAGYDVRVWNRSRERAEPLAADGRRSATRLRRQRTAPTCS